MSGARVLLVDDDALQLKLNAKILSNEGFEVVTVVDAALALNEARASRPDLIVSDVLMGEVDGFGLCRAVRADEGLSQIPVLLVSAVFGGENNREQATRVGARALVERSVGFERELAAVRACLSLQGDGSDERGRSKYEERLRLQKQMLDTVNVGISMVSVEGIILEVNQFWEQLTGWKPNEMIGRHVSELTSTDASLIRDEFRDVVASDQAKVRHPVKHRDGHVVWVEIATQMVVRDGVPLMYAVTTDISSKVDAEQRAKKAESALAQAQKMDALGRLTGGIAHDFNNLLAVIMTHAYFLQEELVEQDPRYQDVAEIAAAGERAAALTKQLLAFSRNQRLQLSSVDVNGVIHNLARMLQRLIGEEMRLEIKTSDVGATHADGSQLEQVIMNLVVNARDAMPKGGAVSVETSRVVTVVGDEVGAGEWVCLAVRDEGCGMGEETKRRLFEPFFTTKEKGKGTGLGLSTSYGIVKQFGGHILVDSEMGRGTVMRVLLPLVRNEILEAPARSSAAIGKRGTETVLLVEDDRAVRAALVRVLEERGYDVVAAGSMTEAMERVREHSRTVELIVCDVVMPGASGPEAVVKLIAEAPRAKVLLMSGYTDHALLDAEMVASAGFLQKPFAPDVFSQKVREVLAGEVA